MKFSMLVSSLVMATIEFFTYRKRGFSVRTVAFATFLIAMMLALASPTFACDVQTFSSVQSFGAVAVAQAAPICAVQTQAAAVQSYAAPAAVQSFAIQAAPLYASPLVVQPLAVQAVAVVPQKVVVQRQRVGLLGRLFGSRSVSVARSRTVTRGF